MSGPVGGLAPIDVAPVDVVVISYNSAPHLGRALASIPAGATVTVVDNASSDDSADIARQAGARVVVNPVNVGFGAAANQAVALGHHELVLLLNPDAVLRPDTLQVLVRALADDPGLAVVSPRVVRPDGSDERVRWPFPSARGAWLEAFGLHRLGWPGRSGPNGSVGGPEPGFVIGACFLVRRALFEQLGGFDRRFWLYAEESDLCRRLDQAGWRVAVVEGAEVTHVGGASSVGIESITAEHFARGAELFVAKHQGRSALVSLRLAQLVGSAPRALVLRDPARRRWHRYRLSRAARLLVTGPTRIPDDNPLAVASPPAVPGSASNPIGAAPGDLVVCSLEAWDDVWRRNQFFVRELLALDPTRRVLFVEPPFDAVHERRRRSGRRRQPGLRPLPSDPRVVRLEPLKLWPRRAGPMADRSLRRQVRAAGRRLGFTDPALWVNDASYAGLASETGWPAVYDITDDWTVSGDGPRATERIADQEGRLFDECQRVVVCSPGLATSRSDRRPDVVVIPNGVDVAHLQRGRPRPADLAEGDQAVYVGTLHTDRLDVDLVEWLADARPDLTVTLVGPDALDDASRARLDAHDNVARLGPRPYQEVPGYLQHASVVIVPHVVSAFTESLDPIKAYECLAVGRPTVATAVAGFRGLPEPIRVVGRDEFVPAVLEALDRPQPSRPTIAATWSERARAFDRQLRGAQADAASSGAPTGFGQGSSGTPPTGGARIVWVDRPTRVLGGLVQGWWRRSAVVIEGGEQVLEGRGGVAARARRLACRMAKPVVLVDSPGARDRLGAIPTALIPPGPAGRSEALEELTRRLAARGAPRFVAVNGRYRSRPTTGVERVAAAVVAHSLGPIAVFAPSPRLGRGPVGHLWEQVVLPLRLLAHRSRLWSPCNFGPLVVRNQILTIHDVAPLDRPEWFAPGYRRWIRAQWWLQYHRVRAVTVVSQFTRDRLVARWGERDRLVVIPDGVEPVELDDSDPVADQAAPADPTVCVVGSLEPRKNLATLVAAMVRVRAGHPDARLLVVGDVGDPRVFASSAPDLSAAWIERRGRVDDQQLAAAVRAASCLAYVSLYEGFGLPPLEAMALGTPVVASDLPAIREVCGPAAVLVDPTDPDAVAQGILSVLAMSPTARAELSAAGRRRAAELTWTCAAAALETLIWS